MRPIELLYGLFPFLKPAAAERRVLPAAPDDPTLTEREMQVAWGIYHGLSNAQIAGELHISVSTVKTYVHSLLGKYRVASRWDLREILRQKWVI